MEQVTFEAVMRSEQFRFTVGPDKREFSLPAAVVAMQSKALRNLVCNEDFTEGRKKHVVLESVDEHTFVLFCEYIYTGKYRLEVPTGKGEESVGSEPADEEDGLAVPEPESKTTVLEESWDVPVAKKKKKVSKQQSAWRKFVKASHIWPSTGASFLPKECESSGERLLLHAKMFVFADYYGVTELASLSIYGLHQALVAFDLRDDTLGDMDRLLRYVLEEPRPGRIVDLVNSYAACKINELWRSEDFRKLLMTQKELFEPVIGMVLDRLD